MKQFLTSLFVLFITFSCQIKKPPEKEINLTFELTETFQIKGQFKNYQATKYEFGIIYMFNPSNEELENLIINENINQEILTLDEDNNFSFIVNTDGYNIYNYISSFVVRAFVKDKEGNVFYSKKTLNSSLYHLALNSNSDYSEEIVNEVNSRLNIDNDITINASIDSINRGFNVEVNYDQINENNIYGIFYKTNALLNEQEDLKISSDNLIFSFSVGLMSNNLNLLFNNFTKEQYFDNYSFRAFVYDVNEKTITYSNKTKTVSLYELALNDNSEFSQEVVRVFENEVTIINKIEIFTDVNKEYEVHSYSEGIKVSMEYDFKEIVLTVELLEGYRFSNSLSKEDIIVHIVSDNEIVKKFSVEMSAEKIIITYDDHGWGPPM